MAKKAAIRIGNAASASFLPTAGVHLEMRVLAKALDFDERVPLGELETNLCAPILARAPGRDKECFELLVARDAAELRPEIETSLGVETGVKDAVRGQPAPIAGATKRLGGRGDDAERGPVGKTEPFGRSPALEIDGRRGSSRALFDDSEHLPFREYAFRGPPGRASHVHVLDETHLRSDGLPEIEKVEELVVVYAPNDDGVELQLRESRRTGGLDAGEDVLESVAARDLAEPLRLQGIEAHRDPRKPRAFQSLRLCFEKKAVRGQRHFREPGVPRQEADEFG